MTKASWIKTVLCMPSRILSGFVYIYDDERLLDVLNNVSRRTESRSKVLELIDVEINNLQSGTEYQPSMYVKKSSICFIGTWEQNGGRGICTKKGYSDYPYVKKLPISVYLDLPSFKLHGYVHCARGQMASHLLEKQNVFLPMTNVEVQPSENKLWLDIAFVAVNLEQILCLQQEDIPLLQVSPRIKLIKLQTR